jgi:hypothetical protein
LTGRGIIRRASKTKIPATIYTQGSDCCSGLPAAIKLEAMKNKIKYEARKEKKTKRREI